MPPNTRQRRPTYEMLDFYPMQGDWSADEYLGLETNRLVEFSDGYLEFQPMPDEVHQWIAAWIYRLVRDFFDGRGRGAAVQAPFRIRIDERNYREPDIAALVASDDPRRGRKFWSGADLVFEVVSPDSPERDYQSKRRDYALARVTEYWIVDPRRAQLTLLRLDGSVYSEVGVFGLGAKVPSAIAPGLIFDVSECFAAADDAAKNDEPQA